MLLNPFGELLKDLPHLEKRAFLCLSSFMEQLHVTYYKNDDRKHTEQTAKVQFTPLPSLSKHLTASKNFVKVTYSKDICYISGKGMRYIGLRLHGGELVMDMKAAEISQCSNGFFAPGAQI